MAKLVQFLEIVVNEAPGGVAETLVELHATMVVPGYLEPILHRSEFSRLFIWVLVLLVTDLFKI